MGSQQIFSQVTGVISGSMLHLLAPEVEVQKEILRSTLSTLDLPFFQIDGQNCEDYCISGTLEQLIYCAEIFETKLHSQISGSSKDDLDFSARKCYLCKQVLDHSKHEEFVANENKKEEQHNEEVRDKEGEPEIESDGVQIRPDTDLKINSITIAKGSETAIRPKGSDSRKERKTFDTRELSDTVNRLFKQGKRKHLEEGEVDDDKVELEGSSYRPVKCRTKFGRKIKVPSKFRGDSLKKQEVVQDDVSDDNNDDVDDKNWENNMNMDNDRKTGDDTDQSHFKKNTRKFVISVGKFSLSNEKRSLKKYYEDRMPYKFFCNLCSYKSKRQTHYDKHMLYHTTHPDISLFECEQCDFKAIRASVLFKHKLSHEPSLSKCPKCPYQTNSTEKLNYHLKKKHDPRGNASMAPLSCKYCGFETLSRIKLSLHLKDRHSFISDRSRNDGVFRCLQPNCSYSSKKKANLMRHQDNVHSEVRPHLCEQCGQAFKRRDALTSHKETHLDKSLRCLPYSCDKCGKAFKANAALKEHQFVHTSQRSHQCHICGQLFKSIIVQRRHIQTIHSNPCKYMCSTCKRTFGSKYAMKRHQRTHDNIDVSLTLAELQAKILQGQIDLGEGHGEKTELSGPEVAGASEAMTSVDENISAIETITITSQNLGDYSSQLQGVASQLQTAGDGDVYIQGMESSDQGEVSVMNVGSEIRRILVSTATGNVTATLEPGAPLTDQTMNEQTQQEVFVGENHSPETMKELYIQTEICDEPIKQTNIQLIDQSGSGSELFNQAQQVFNVEGYDGETLIQHAQVSGEDGQVLELVSQDGQTYRLKLESVSSLLGLPSAGSTNTG